MARITVYLYEIWDPFDRTFIRARCPATRRAIDAAGGVLLHDTAQEVDVRCVNEDGILVSPPARAGQLTKPQGPRTKSA